MADDVTIVISAQDNASAKINTVNKSLDGLAPTGKQASAAMGLLNAAISSISWAGVASGILTVVTKLQQFEKAAVESNIVAAKQEAILKATGNAAGLSARQLAEMATELSRLNEIDDEAIMSAQSLMLTFRNIGAVEFPRAMQAAADLQTTFGGLESSTMQLGKALNDPLKGITALARAGVTFSEEQKKQIANFVETNQLAKAQAVILAEVEAQVGGTAKAIADAGDSSKRLDIAWGNLEETLGGRLVPAQKKWNDTLASTIDAVTESIQASYDYADALDQVVESEIVSQEYLGKLSAEEYGKELARLTAQQQRWNLTSDLMVERWQKITKATQEATVAEEEMQIAMTQANEEMIRGVEQTSQAYTSFTESYKTQSDKIIEIENALADARRRGYSEQGSKILEIKDRLGEEQAKLEELKQAYEIKTKTVLLGYIQQKLARDGVLDDAETDYILKLGEAWGVYAAGTAAMYAEEIRKADAYAAALKRLNGLVVSTTVITNYTTKGYSDVGGGPSTTSVTPTGKKVDTMRASGTGGDWLTVPPGYPNDTYTVGMSSGEKYNVATQAQTPGQGGAEMNLSAMTVRALASAIAGEISTRLG